MKFPFALLIAIAAGPAATGFVAAKKMAQAEEPEDVGLTSVGDAYFPNPGELPWARLPGGGFEPGVPGGDVKSRGFLRAGGKGDDGAPQGDTFLSQKDKLVANLTVDAAVRQGAPYLLTTWLRTTGTGASGYAASVTDEIQFGKGTPLDVPDTGGAWKRVGFFFRTAPGASAVRVSLRFPAGSGAALDDVRLREATGAEFSSAYRGWRSRYPARDLSPRPGDGKNLALFVSKLSAPRVPGEPLRVMGIGSSYTNMLGNGERLVQWIREKFPQAPPILYEKHVGSSVEFDFTRGWMRQHVLGKRPDLVILYSGGKAADLDKLLADFRAHSTADIIVASLHLNTRDKDLSDAVVNAPKWDAIREVARKHGCEWVDSRREWAVYLKEQGKPIPWLLKDAVHQSDHGALVINESICRHIVPNRSPAYRLAERERFLPFPAGRQNGPLAERQEGVRVNGGSGEGSGSAARSVVLRPGGKVGVRVRFHGNRIDLIGRRSAGGGKLGGGGKASPALDGVPLDKLPVFTTTLILPGRANYRPDRRLTADRAPHMIRLGEPAKIVPQTWTLRMTDDTGGYDLIGSVTGPDGSFQNGEDALSDSGQIGVPTALWRRRLAKDRTTYSNPAGDTFTWRVNRATAPEVPFRGTAGELFSIPLADQLDNGWHELTIGAGAVSGGPCELVGFRVYTPPE